MNLPCYFENQEEMKLQCMKIAGNECIKTKCRNSGTYFKIFCCEPNCKFQITYNRRVSNKSKDGYYLVNKGTCLEHQDNCPNSIANVDQTKDPKYLSKQILPLFEKGSPSLNEIKNTIQCFNNQNFTTSELKYIKKLAKKHFFKGASSILSQLIEFCKNLVSVHNWKFDMEFVDGMLATIILFPPWFEN